MPVGEPIDPDDLAQLAEELTVWASPGLVVDDAYPELGALAALTVVPSITVQTSDPHSGAELVDVVLSSLLEQGFALVTTFDGPGLAGLPLLSEWSAQLDHGGQLLQLLEPGGALYDGDLGAAVPDGWHAALLSRGQLIVLVGSAIDLGLDDRTEQIDAARRTGGVVGAQVPVHVVELRPSS